MGKPKYDGVIEAVHYDTSGQIKWVRAYLRHGVIFSDRVLMDRKSLIDQVQAGKKFLTGKRVPRMGGTFEVSSRVQIVWSNNQDFLITGDIQSERDHLDNVPIL